METILYFENAIHSGSELIIRQTARDAERKLIRKRAVKINFRSVEDIDTLIAELKLVKAFSKKKTARAK